MTFGSTAIDIPWELIQFHFHDGSEHTLNGNRFDAELHLVHQSKEGNLFVIGIMLSGNDNGNDQAADDSLDVSETLEPLVQAYESIADSIVNACNNGDDRGQEANKASHANLAVSDIPENWSPYDFVPNANDFAVGAFFYTGSLTTPPCSNGVTWYDIDTPLSVSSNQISRIKSIIGGSTSPSWPSCSFEIPEDYVGTYRPTQSAGSRQVVHLCNF